MLKNASLFYLTVLSTAVGADDSECMIEFTESYGRTGQQISESRCL